MSGFLLGYLAEREKELRAEIALTNHLLSQARVGNRLSEVLIAISADLARVFGGERVYEVVTQAGFGTHLPMGHQASPQPAHEIRELAPSENRSALMQEYPHTFYMKREKRWGHSH